MTPLTVKVRRRGLERLHNAVLVHVPTRRASRLRVTVLRWIGAQIGAECYVSHNVIVLGAEHLIFEDHVSVPRGTTLDARGGLRLCEYALIGFGSTILTHTHNSSDVGRPIQEQGMFSRPVVIGARAWLGTRSIVLPGVRIGADCIIGAGSVVARDVPESVIAVGSPARQVRARSVTPSADRVDPSGGEG